MLSKRNYNKNCGEKIKKEKLRLYDKMGNILMQIIKQ